MDQWQGVWIVIPAYNEEKSIGDVLAELCRLPYKVIVVDDGSTDRTSQISLEYPVVLLRHAVNLGQGAALQTGLTYALSQPGIKAVVTYDADGQHDPQDINRLIAPVINAEADVALGTRFSKGAKTVNMPAGKRRVLKLAVAFTRLTTGLAVSDTHNGLRAFSAGAASQINITANRMAHASEILNQIHKLHLKITEVPVSVLYTPYSLSKGQSISEAVNILWDIFAGGLR